MKSNIIKINTQNNEVIMMATECHKEYKEFNYTNNYTNVSVFCDGYELTHQHVDTNNEMDLRDVAIYTMYLYQSEIEEVHEKSLRKLYRKMGRKMLAAEIRDEAAEIAKTTNDYKLAKEILHQITTRNFDINTIEL